MPGMIIGMNPGSQARGILLLLTPPDLLLIEFCRISYNHFSLWGFRSGRPLLTLSLLLTADFRLS